jgi:hypothetical protein
MPEQIERADQLAPAGEGDPAAETRTGHATAAASIWRPTEESIVLNAQAACDEARRHIAAQARDSEALDTKAAALLTVTAGVFSLSVTRVQIGEVDQLFAGATTLTYLAILVTCLIQATRPRDSFSYGAWPSFLSDLVADYPNWTVMQRLAESLAKAREGNVKFLYLKQRWYERALVTLPFVAIGIGFMAISGAVR